jgi:dipeptidyl aminopeptidase/acylaminoacyl peptidase
MAATAAPCGSWRSSITADLVAEAGPVFFKFSDIQPGQGGAFWIEARPEEDGRDVVCFARSSGEVVTVTPPGFDARTRCNEYGGGAFFVHGPTVFFSHFGDQRLYRQAAFGAPPIPITSEPPEPASLRYADGVTTPDGKLIVCVRESHDNERVTNELVALPSDGSAAPWVVASGSDFYSSPRIRDDGRFLAWTQWDHPNMPWDGCELLVGRLSARGRVTESTHLAGGRTESIVQPEWSPDGALHFVSDRSGWWNIYRAAGNAIEAVCPMEAEFGAARWTFGLSRFAFLSDGRVAASYTDAGVDHLALIRGGKAEDVRLDFTAYHPESLRSDGRRLWFIAASDKQAPAIACYDTTTRATELVRRSAQRVVTAGFLSKPRLIEFPTDSGLAHALFYPPANDHFVPLQGEKPPLRVAVHGGPTSRYPAGLDPEWQFFTSRGWAVVLVNYGGSTGYGRSYRERLTKGWGVVDRADAVAAARHLADRGDIDPSRVVISGGSAGGYTTLLTLCLENVFAAGISYFGIADLETFARDTHNLESHYCDGLVGPYPEAASIYRDRSPVYLADRVRSPLLILQGREDEVVPRSQAREMLAALDANRVPHAYLEFEDEGHGFRRRDTRKRAAEAELYFLAKVLGLPLPEGVAPIEIRHL